MSTLWVVLGLALVLLVLADAFDTLLSTRIRSSRTWPTDLFYRASWRIWRAGCLRVRRPHRRESLLSAYGPLSIVFLLGLWTLGQILGWGLVWWGLRGEFATPIHTVREAVYYSGVVYFSIGFGDVLPAEGIARVLTILEAFGGLGTLGLVIGFLPSLTAAYQSREIQLLRLDDLTDARIAPATLVRSHVREPGDFEQLEALFEDWDRWCAELFETHTSFPMLLLFRSQHRGHSWVTALGVVTDSAIAYLACVPGSERGPAMRLYRQSVRTVQRLATRIGVEPNAPDPMATRFWSVGYSIMQGVGGDLRPFEESYELLLELREDFDPWMEALIDELLAPRGFWGVTSADHLTETTFADFEDD
jgi:hypothetical protein